MTDNQMYSLWKHMLHTLSTPCEFHTVPRSQRTPLWFCACAKNNFIFVSNAQSHIPSCHISSPRRLTFEEFLRIHPIFLRRERGESVSKDAIAATYNQVYWFALIKELL